MECQSLEIPPADLDRQWLRNLWSFVEHEIPSANREGRLVARIRPAVGKRYRDVEAADMDGFLRQVRSTDTVMQLDLNLSGQIGSEVRQIKLVLGPAAQGETRGSNVTWVAGSADLLTEMFLKVRRTDLTRTARRAAGAIAFVLTLMSVLDWWTGRPFYLEGLGSTMALLAALIPWRRPARVRFILGGGRRYDLEALIRLISAVAGLVLPVAQAVKLFLGK